MKKNLAARFLLPMMALIFFSVSTQAETTKCKAITKLPYVIEVSGVYCLKKNLTFATKGVPTTDGYAIRIESSAPGTVLDLNDFTLSGGAAPSTANTTGIRVGATNVTVRNGTVQKFNVGIYSANSNGIVEDLVVSDSFSIGMWFEIANNIIRNNTILDTGGYTGAPNASAYAILTTANNISIHDNTILGVIATGSGYGVGISSSNTTARNIVSNNTISDIYGTAGIWFQGGTHHIASGNRITKPGSYGIAFGGTGSYMDNLVVGATSSSYNGTGTAAGSTNY